MDQIQIKLDAVNPYVRYSHCFTIGHGTPFVNVVPYDYRLLYIAGGEGHIKIGGNLFAACEGCLFLWRPGIQYSYLPEPDRPFSIYGINFDFTLSHSAINNPVALDRADDFDCRKIIEQAVFTDFPPFNDIVMLEHMQASENTFIEINNEYMTRRNFYAGKLRGRFLSLLIDIARAITVPEAAGNRAAERVDEIIAFIQAHYNSELTNGQVAREFNFHPVYISRLMIQYTGMPLHRYLIRYRISVALNLLQSTNLPVAEIADKVGFTDLNYFSRCFKKVVGQSPRSYLSR